MNNESIVRPSCKPKFLLNSVFWKKLKTVQHTRRVKPTSRQTVIYPLGLKQTRISPDSACSTRTALLLQFWSEKNYCLLLTQWTKRNMFFLCHKSFDAWIQQCSEKTPSNNLILSIKGTRRSWKNYLIIKKSARHGVRTFKIIIRIHDIWSSQVD